MTEENTQHADQSECHQDLDLTDTDLTEILNARLDKVVRALLDEEKTDSGFFKCLWLRIKCILRWFTQCNERKDALGGHAAGEPSAEKIVASLLEHYAKLRIFTSANSVHGLHAKGGAATHTDRSLPYRLAVADLFVERALEYLGGRAWEYKLWGTLAYGFGVFVVVVGATFSGYGYLKNNEMADLKNNEVAIFLSAIELKGQPVTQARIEGSAPTNDSTKPASATDKNPANKGVDLRKPELETMMWLEFLNRFVKAFTFYGFLVLLAVSAWRVGKACLDQSERLYGKRHALRQGRLFIHLSNGKVSIEELETAFNWNVTQENAFSDISTDAKAPWGTVVTDALKTVPDMIRAGRAK